MTESLYDESLLSKFEFNPPEGLRIRPLSKDDFHKGKKDDYFFFLWQLAKVW